MTRKNPHLPQFHKPASSHRDIVASPRRRAHGLFARLALIPSAQRKAEQRKHLYMNSAARRMKVLADVKAAA